MKYAITYTIDEDWSTTDTVLVKLKKNPLDMTTKELSEMFEHIIGNLDYAERIAEDTECWFVRNVEDTDYVLGML